MIGVVRDSVTAPASPQAADIAGLLWLSVWLGVAVWVAVMVLLAVPVLRSWRRRRATSAPTAAAERRTGGPTGRRPAAPRLAPPASVLDEPLATRDPDAAGPAQHDATARARLLWVGGIVGPLLILAVLLVASGRVAASTAHVERDGELVIDVVGHMFWWEVHYPEEGITTANEIHMPVDRPVRLRLASEDVIHSFWVPRVHGKIDLIPGHESWLSFVPTETGRLRGACAEFCGIAHAQMVLHLEVQEPDDFDAWVAGQRADAATPATGSAADGARVFLGAGCASCHAVRGTEAIGGVGPDLTHLATRDTLASGIVPNDREHLERLVTDPWGLKPGMPMPPTVLDDDELTALLDYLEGLDPQRGGPEQDGPAGQSGQSGQAGP